jgi:hypothetical protein
MDKIIGKRKSEKCHSGHENADNGYIFCPKLSCKSVRNEAGNNGATTYNHCYDTHI